MVGYYHLHTVRGAQVFRIQFPDKALNSANVAEGKHPQRQAFMIQSNRATTSTRA